MTELRLAMLGIASAFLVVACGPSAPEAPAETEAQAATESEVPAQPDAAVETQDLATTLADRPEGDRVRDSGRKPAEVLGIVGVEAGMDVLDLIAAGGWYTEVLSVAVGTDGNVTAQNPGWMHGFRDGALTAPLAVRVSERLSNVSLLDNEWTDLAEMEPQFDVALSALNIHDVYYIEGREGADQFAAAVYNVLKPGGVFGVVEHVVMSTLAPLSGHRFVSGSTSPPSEQATSYTCSCFEPFSSQHHLQHVPKINWKKL